MSAIRRVLIPLALAAAVAAPARAADLPGGAPYVFPVIGGASYYDDFGDPRPQGRHEGNDLLARKKTPVVAAQDGVVKLSYGPRSGYMITLEGRTREFYYIHLNNDIRGNDNRGGPRTAYARGLKSGMHVRMGEVIGFVGNSGDANSTVPHLHFEEHLLDGTVVDPYPNLRRAPILLFGRPLSALHRPGAKVTLDLAGRLGWVVDGEDGPRIALRLSRVRVLNGSRMSASRLVVLHATAAAAETLATVPAGAAVILRTTPSTPTLARQTLEIGAWQVASVRATG